MPGDCQQRARPYPCRMEITLDFSVLPDDGGFAPRPLKTVPKVAEQPITERDLYVDRSKALVEHHRRTDHSQLEAMKAMYTASGGHLAEVARAFSVTPDIVRTMAGKHRWPVYGDGLSSATKSRKTRLEGLATRLEEQMYEMLDSMGVERKDVDARSDKGLASAYVASLSQRNAAFGSLFDRYMRVMAILEPETFAADDDPSNHAARRMRDQGHDRGLNKVNRELAEFFGRGIVAGLADELNRRGEPQPRHAPSLAVVEDRDINSSIMDAEVVDDD